MVLKKKTCPNRASPSQTARRSTRKGKHLTIGYHDTNRRLTLHALRGRQISFTFIRYYISINIYNMKYEDILWYTGKCITDPAAMCCALVLGFPTLRIIKVHMLQWSLLVSFCAPRKKRNWDLDWSQRPLVHSTDLLIVLEETNVMIWLTWATVNI